MRDTLHKRLWLVAPVVVTACALGTPPVEPLRSTRPADQCQAALDSAQAGFIATQPPKPKVVTLPQYIPVNTSRRQKVTLHLDIDTAGRVVPGRIRVTGTTDPGLAARLKESA